MDTINGKKEHNITEILGTSMENLRKLVDVDTVIGNPITTPDGTTIIPVSKVTFGFAAGGADIPTTKPNAPFGGGSSGAMTIAPVAFLVVSQGHVELLNISAPHNSVDRVVDMMPGVIDKLGAVFSGFDTKSGGKVVTTKPAEPAAAPRPEPQDPVEP